MADPLIDSAIAFLENMRQKKKYILTSRPVVKSAPIPKPKPAPQLKISPPPPPPPKPKPIPQPKVKVELEKAPKPEQDDMSAMRKMMAAALPDLFIHPKPLDDRNARKIASAWKDKSFVPDIPLFVTAELRGHARLLHALSHAVDRRFGPSRVIDIGIYERENRWDTVLSAEHLKLILIPDIALWKMPNLLTHFDEKNRQLLKVKTLVLPDLSLYEKDPLLKRGLWNMIKKAL
ncbi:MAG: hypothetical protein MRY21_07920 [Simkaniaceae bacterium]|nr:hypothetical protein [Simkaniaceae bacterium]